jgi:hypothetical protein
MNWLFRCLGAPRRKPDIDDFLADLLNMSEDGARDDAAEAIARSPDAEWAQRALIYACWSPKLNDWLRYNCGEYLAEIWLRAPGLTEFPLDNLPRAASESAAAYLLTARNQD